MMRTESATSSEMFARSQALSFSCTSWAWKQDEPRKSISFYCTKVFQVIKDRWKAAERRYLLRCGGPAGADGPDGFIRQYHFTPVLHVVCKYTQRYTVTLLLCKWLFMKYYIVLFSLQLHCVFSWCIKSIFSPILKATLFHLSWLSPHSLAIFLLGFVLQFKSLAQEPHSGSLENTYKKKKGRVYIVEP